MDSEISKATGGELHIIAFTSDLSGDGAETVEMFYQGAATGLYLDLMPNVDPPIVFTMGPVAVDSGVPRGWYVFEIQSVSKAGRESLLWPYLNVE